MRNSKPIRAHGTIRQSGFPPLGRSRPAGMLGAFPNTKTNYTISLVIA